LRKEEIDKKYQWFTAFWRNLFTVNPG
jgi:hypothetical protein